MSENKKCLLFLAIALFAIEFYSEQFWSFISIGVFILSIPIILYFDYKKCKDERIKMEEFEMNLLQRKL